MTFSEAEKVNTLPLLAFSPLTNSLDRLNLIIVVNCSRGHHPLERQECVGLHTRRRIDYMDPIRGFGLQFPFTPLPHLHNCNASVVHMV